MYQSNNSSVEYNKMDDHLRDLLQIHRSKFLEVDVERLIPFMRETGLLTQEDLEIIRRSPGQKVHTLLDILPSKGSQAFGSLCLALENTSPHLLTIMLLAASQRMQYHSSRQGSITAGLTSDSECEEKKSSASSAGGVGDGGPSTRQQQHVVSSSSPPLQGNVVSSHDYNMEQSNVALLKAELKIVTKDKEALKKELKKVMRERDEALTRRSDQNQTYGTIGKHGSVSASDKSLTGSREFDSLKFQHEKALFDLQALRKENMELSRKCDSALKDVEYYRKQERNAYSSLQTLRLQYDEVAAEKQKLEHELNAHQSIMEEDRKEIADLRRQQQEAVTQEGSGEAINQLYISTVRKYEALKEDYESLRKRYSDVVASHSSNISKLELSEVTSKEEASRFKKQYEEVLREKNCLTQQCTEAIRQWDAALREKNKLQEEILKVKERNEEIMKEMNSHLIQRQTLSKDLKRLQEERNAAMQEYSLVMSERDTVHKEMDKLQEELNIASKKIKSVEQSTKEQHIERESLELQLETLKREIASSLHDRDKAIRECNELRERFGAKEDNNKDWEHPYKDYDSYKQDRDLKLKEGSDLVSSSHEMYTKAQKERLENLDQANQEIDRLRKTVEKLQGELQEAKREAEVSKRRRDWAFNERDKIVQERESIRAHCDKLRHERDRAVSDLADALRDSDDMMKQRNEASNELKELKERLEAERENSAAVRQMIPHNNSRDSAIDTDMHEWEIESLQMQTGLLSERDLGFEICGTRDDSHYGSSSSDGVIHVSSITKDGPFDGKLRVHDQLVRINGLDCTGASKSNIYNAVISGGGWVHMTVRRRRSGGRTLYKAHLHCPHSVVHGLTLHTGVYIANILQGSPAAKEGNLAVGDRLLNINGKPVDNLSFNEEPQRILDLAGEIIQLTVLKSIGTSSLSAPLSTASSGHNMTEDEKSSSKSYIPRDNPLSPHRNRDIALRITRGTGHPAEEPGGLRLGSSERVVYTVTKPIEEKVGSGTGAWGQFKNIVKPRRHSKERTDLRGDSREKEEKKKLASNPTEQERANDAIAELDSVIDFYNYKPNDKASTGTTKRSKKKEKDKSGGTWPKCRTGLSPWNPNSGTINTSPWRKERPPLSMFFPTSTAGTSEYDKIGPSYQFKHTLPRTNNSPLSPRSRNYTIYKNSLGSSHSTTTPYSSNEPFSSSGIYSEPQSSMYPSHDIYGELSSRCGSIEHKTDDAEKERGHHSSPDTSLDFSVRSGNVGKEELEYLYAKKNRGKYPHSENESNFGIDPSSQPSSLPPVYMSRPSPLHHLTDRVPSNSRIPHTHSSLYSPPNVGLRVPPFSPYAFSLHHSHNHPHTGTSSPYYSSPPPQIGNASHFLSPSRSGDSILSSPGHDRLGYYESQISPTSSLGGGLGGLYRSASPSNSNRMNIHNSRANHSHAVRASSDEPSSNHHSVGSPPYSEYQRNAATIPRKKDDDRLRSTSGTIGSKNSNRMRYIDPGSEASLDAPENMPNSYPVDIVGSSSSIGQTGTMSPVRSQVTQISHSVRNQEFPLYDVSRNPQPGDIRNIYIEKESEPLGIQIRCLENGGVYVSSVTTNSLASQVGICIGDQLLEVCGINLRTATKQMASTVLSQCRSSVTMLVQYNPDKYQEAEGWESSSGGSIAMGSRSGTPTPRNSPKSSRAQPLLFPEDEDDLPPSSSSTLRAPLDPLDHSLSPSSRSTLTRPATQHIINMLKRQDTLSRRSPSSSDPSTPTTETKSSFSSEDRHIFIEMKSQNLGIKMIGGNAHGIYIHSIAPDSPAANTDLRIGDRILNYNGTDLRHTTAEQAAFELAKPTDKISMIVKWDYQTYSQVKDQPGDSFYVRAVFDKLDPEGTDLRFNKNDILYVDNTLFKPNYWRAWLVDEDGHKRECGTIPSQGKFEEDFLSQRNLGDLDNGRRGSSSSRRSFFRRKKHSRSSSRDSKELASFSDVSLNNYSEASPVADEPLPPAAYVRVERLDYLVRRPVVMVGPLWELVCDKLTQEVPQKFIRSGPEIRFSTQQDIENLLQKNVIVDYRRRGSHYEITTVAQVKEVCDKSYHGILDISLNAVERLHRHNIYPIVLVLKFKHHKHIRDISDANERLSQKEAKEMFDITNKTEQEYKHLISAVITAGVNMTYICTQVKSIVDREQSKTLWVSASLL